jgi:S-adenosylhomocysteine hydrolase
VNEVSVQARTSDIKDAGLARAGGDLIEWAAREMPVLD